MLLHSVQEFMARPDVAIVVCVLPKSHAGDPPPWLFQCDLDRLLVSVGGRERGESVYNGLEDLPPEVRVVLVHDAARPLVNAATIDGGARSAEGPRRRRCTTAH
jgi:2-C-methyl-D-erythritol 4-phosphate cytidylyltransferase